MQYPNPISKRYILPACFICGKRVNPDHYQVIYHSFTGKYFCKREHYIEAQHLAESEL